jgi:hypothetical protein
LFPPSSQSPSRGYEHVFVHSRVSGGGAGEGGAPGSGEGDGGSGHGGGGAGGGVGDGGSMGERGGERGDGDEAWHTPQVSAHLALTLLLLHLFLLNILLQ